MNTTDNNWGESTLASLGELARGKSKHRPRNDPKLFGGAYPFIQTSDIKHANYYVNSYSETYNETGLAQSKLWPKDTLCITIAANIAESALLSFPACFPDSVVGFIKNPEKSDVRFVKYALDYYKKSYQQRSQGAAQDNLSLEKIESLKLKVPNVQVQRKIANIISAYDELVENNEKRIKTLEEIAQRIYTEWFVNFKYPGHEKAKLTDSPLGKIPAGWKVKQFYEVVNNFDSKRKPISTIKRAEMKGSIPYYGAAKIIDYINSFLFDGRYLLIAEDGSVITDEGKPVLQFVDEKFWVSNHAHVVNGKLLSNETIYLRLSNLNIRPLITGAAQPKITKDNLSRVLFIIPPDQTKSFFDSLIIKYFDEIFSLKGQIKILTRTRDLLIPQLVTGRRAMKL